MRAIMCCGCPSFAELKMLGRKETKTKGGSQNDAQLSWDRYCRWYEEHTSLGSWPMSRGLAVGKVEELVWPWTLDEEVEHHWWTRWISSERSSEKMYDWDVFLLLLCEYIPDM